MENNSMIMVTSASDHTLVINVPELTLHKTWKKRGAKYPIDRKVLFQAFYEPSVEGLFRDGKLITNDVEFLKEVGLIEESAAEIISLTEAYITRLMKTMPVTELKKELEKLSFSQREELANYAVEHYKELQMDRVDIISKATGKNIMKAIEHHRKAEEE